MKVITTEENKAIGLLQNLQNTLLRLVLITMYKAFVRSHQDYGDMIYNETYNDTFQKKLESMQCNACLALSAAIRGSSIEELSHELGLESSNVDIGTGNFAYFIRFSKK